MKKVDKSHKLLRNLKSQGLSLNTIIIAAIVLIVLIVLWAIFTGRMGSFTKNLSEQELNAKREAQILAANARGEGCVMKAGDAGNCNKLTNANCEALGCVDSTGSGATSCQAKAPDCSKFTDASSCETAPQATVCEWKSYQ